MYILNFYHHNSITFNSRKISINPRQILQSSLVLHGRLQSFLLAAAHFHFPFFLMLLQKI